MRGRADAARTTPRSRPTGRCTLSDSGDWGAGRRAARAGSPRTARRRRLSRERSALHERVRGLARRRWLWVVESYEPDRLADRPRDRRARGGHPPAGHRARRPRVHRRRRHARRLLPAGPDLPPRPRGARRGRRRGPAGHAALGAHQRCFTGRSSTGWSRANLGRWHLTLLDSGCAACRCTARRAGPSTGGGGRNGRRAQHGPARPRLGAALGGSARAVRPALLRDRAGAARPAWPDSRPDDPLPSDAMLCEEFGVSRMTARNAVQRLAQEGLVYRVPGRGTFVAEPPVHRQAGSLLSLHRRDAPPRPRAELARARRRRAGASRPPRRPGSSWRREARVVAVRRLRVADEEPMAHRGGGLPRRRRARCSSAPTSSTIRSTTRWSASGHVPTVGRARLGAEAAGAETPRSSTCPRDRRCSSRSA